MRLFNRQPASIAVSRDDPRSNVAFAHTSTSSSRMTSPTPGNREKSICGGRKSKPFLPDPDTEINVNTCSHVGRFTCAVRWKAVNARCHTDGYQCLRRLVPRPRARPLLSTRTIATFFRRRLGSAVQRGTAVVDRPIRRLVEIGLKAKK